MKSELNLFKWITFLVLLVPSLSAARDIPAWIEGEPERYPNNLYITASGAASDFELAKDRALANLSKIFEAHISEVSTAKSDTYVSLHNMKENVAKSQRLAQLVRVSTDKIIQGAQIAKLWKDDQLAIYYALAVLDRKQARNNIMDEITRIDDETIDTLNAVKYSNKPLQRIAMLNEVISEQTNRKSLNDMLKVINLHGRGYSSEWQISDLQRQLEHELSLLKISSVLAETTDNDKLDKKLVDLLESSMANSGFPAVDGGDYQLVINLGVQDIGLKQGWYWMRGKLSIKLVEVHDKVRRQEEWLLKVSALEKDNTHSRLMTQVSKRLNSDLKTFVISAVTYEF